MKKFLHLPSKKEYIYNSGYLMYLVNTNICIPVHLTENSKDWIEITEEKPEYTILSFKQKSGVTEFWTFFEGIGWCRNYIGKPVTSPYTYKEIMNNPLYSIHSVRRESDGEIFTVGDGIKLPFNQYFIISSLKPLGDTIQIFYDNDKYRIHLPAGQKAKKEWMITGLKIDMDPLTNKIYSLKRLSDGIEFKIGDKYKNASGTFTIESFEISGDSISVNAMEGGFCDIDAISKLEWIIIAIKNKINDKVRFVNQIDRPPIDYEIYSVKRLSDNVEFTIGDLCKTKYLKNPCEIKKFNIFFNVIQIFFDNINIIAGLNDNLEKLEKDSIIKNITCLSYEEVNANCDLTNEERNNLLILVNKKISNNEQ